MRTNEELASLVQQGDREATGELWERVSRLVFKLMSRYFSLCAYHNIDPDDLEQEGYFAVIRAAKAFDSGRGFLFTTYLTMHVKTVAREALGLRGHPGRPRNVVSLDEPFPDTKSDIITMGDAIPDESAAAEMERVQNEWHNRQLHEVLAPMLEGVKQKSLDTLYGRFAEGKTLEQIGKECGISREAVRQREKAALDILRRPENMKQLEPYL